MGLGSLKGRTAIVTGSTSGIGLGIARSFAEQGANLVINGLGDPAAVETTRLAIESDFKTQCLYSPANMLKANEIVDMFSLVQEKFGGCDILVNNAGIQHVAPIDEFPDDKWQAIIQINLIAAFHTIKAALPHMKASGWGRIINLASAHALVASPYKSAYVAAKHGIAGLTKTVALEAFGREANS
jgi:3-hydroxybutyrate dehydrogenase